MYVNSEGNLGQDRYEGLFRDARGSEPTDITECVKQHILEAKLWGLHEG